MNSRFRYLYRAYRYRFRVDPGEVHFVREKLRVGQVAVDIGSHKGAYTYWMWRQVGPSGVVFAFEPQPGQVAYLRQVFSAMAYDNVVLVPMALSDREGRLPLYVPSGNGATHGASLEMRSAERGAKSELLEVDLTTLDTFFAGRARGPDFLKIDVEGHESAVLAGGRETLKRHRPAILIECEARHRVDGDVRPVFELLGSIGYEGSFFVNGRRRPLSEFDPSVHQRVDSRSAELPRGYVNNFAFEP